MSTPILQLPGLGSAPTNPYHPITCRRLARGWTQTQLARKAKCSVTVVSQIERGDKKRPTAKLIGRIAKVLGIEPDRLAAEIALGRTLRESE